MRLTPAERKARWRARDPERARKVQRDYAARHPEQMLIKTQRQRCALKGLEPRLTVAEWRWILAYWGQRCAYCGGVEPFPPRRLIGWRKATQRLTLDHPVPFNLGGAHDAANAVPCCPHCNSSKNDTPLGDWLAECQEDHGLDAAAFRAKLATQPVLCAAALGGGTGAAPLNHAPQAMAPAPPQEVAA